MKKILFYSINNTWIPHFETELELMSQHLEQGDDVFVLTCAATLKTCTSNPENLKIGCLKCIRRREAGLTKVGIKSENIFTLKKSVNIVIPESFASVAELKKFVWQDAPLGLCVASTLISEIRDHNFDTFMYYEKIKKNIYAAALAYESCLELFEQIKPDHIYLFNGRFADLYPAVCAAKKLGITFFTHERGGSTATYSLFKNELPHTAFIFMKNEIEELWNNSDEHKEAIGSQWFIDRRRGVEQAWMSFSAQQQKNLLPSGFDSTKKNIIFFNSSIDEFEIFPEWQDPIYGNEVTAVERIISAVGPDYHFYFRVHPCLKNIRNTQISNLKKLEAKKYPNLTFIWPEEIIDSYALMEQSEKIIVFASTIGVEACYWGKPSILIGRAFYEDLDCCYMPKTHEEVLNFITKNIALKDQKSAIKYAYWETTRGIKFKKFKPSGLFTGAFLGEELKPQFGLKDKLFLKWYSKLDAWKIKSLSQQKKGQW